MASAFERYNRLCGPEPLLKEVEQVEQELE